MAADDIAKGALHLIRWGKKIIPATDDEIARFGPQAARVEALRSMAYKLSDDAKRISKDSRDLIVNKDKFRYNQASDRSSATARNAGREEQFDNAFYGGYEDLSSGPGNDGYIGTALADALGAESVSDLLVPGVLKNIKTHKTDLSDYKLLTDPMATGRRFDMTVPNAPESFTNIARSLGERSLLAAPKDIELARRVSMLPPAMQQVYLNLLGEGTDPAQLLQALRLMGQ
jgi:hypothetical protein